MVENLIYSGAFDSIEGIKKVTDRERLLLNYREKKNIKIDEKKDEYSIARDKGKKIKSGGGYYNKNENQGSVSLIINT